MEGYDKYISDESKFGNLLKKWIEHVEITKGISDAEKFINKIMRLEGQLSVVDLNKMIENDAAPSKELAEKMQVFFPSKVAGKSFFSIKADEAREFHPWDIIELKEKMFSDKDFKSNLNRGYEKDLY